MNRLIIFFLFICNLSFASECKNIDEQLKSSDGLSVQTKQELNEVINQFNATQNIESKNYCKLNIVAKLFYKGEYFKHDEEISEKLFYFLANKNYPQAQFNLALLGTRKSEQNPKEIINLLLGIYSKYLRYNDYSHISGKVRILLNDYIEDLTNKVDACHFKTATGADLGDYVDKEKEARLISKNWQLCKETYSKLTSKEANEIVVSTRNALFKTDTDFRREIQWETYENRQKEDALLALLYIGAFVYTLSVPSHTPSGTSFIPDSGCGGFIQCGFSWNPMNLPQIPM